MLYSIIPHTLLYYLRSSARMPWAILTPISQCSSQPRGCMPFSAQHKRPFRSVPRVRHVPYPNTSLPSHLPSFLFLRSVNSTIPRPRRTAPRLVHHALSSARIRDVVVGFPLEVECVDVALRCQS